jgi:hypothetical protein
MRIVLREGFLTEASSFFAKFESFQQRNASQNYAPHAELSLRKGVHSMTFRIKFLVGW